MLWNAVNGSVSLKNAKMSYVSFGHGEKRLVILPGLSDGLATVRGKALLLAPPYRRWLDRFTVYMFSRRDDIPDGFSIRDMARDQAEATASLGLAKVSVMGVSQGGMIAQYLAADNPQMVEKLVIAVSAPRADDMIRANLDRWMDLAKRGDHRNLMIDTAENSYSEGYLKRYRRLYPVIGSIGRPRGYGRFLANAKAIYGFDASNDLCRIGCPTLIIGGAEDRIVGIEASRELNEMIPGSTLYVYEGLGHAAYEEAADFNDRVFGFLESQN